MVISKLTLLPIHFDRTDITCFAQRKYLSPERSERGNDGASRGTDSECDPVPVEVYVDPVTKFICVKKYEHNIHAAYNINLLLSD